MFEREPILDALEDEPTQNFFMRLRQRASDASTSTAHGNLGRWEQTIQGFPTVDCVQTDFQTSAVTISGTIDDSQRAALRDGLMDLHPWRKGPWKLFGVDIDAEWRSDWKWNRIAEALDFRDAEVLDVGCGNGYYGWRMLGGGARRVIGLDPFPLYVAQHHAIKHFIPDKPNHVLIGSDADIVDNLAAFDIVVSMGVLYHRTSPIDHLLSLRHSLRPGGKILLETLVIDQSGETVLVPKSRYAKMRNVWFIPSPSMLACWMQKTGFRQVEIVDVTMTTCLEQRQTDWMHFESLQNFLASDRSTTIEGYPPPPRAVAVAICP